MKIELKKSDFKWSEYLEMQIKYHLCLRNRFLSHICNYIRQLFNYNYHLYENIWRLPVVQFSNYIRGWTEITKYQTLKIGKSKLSNNFKMKSKQIN